MRCMACYADAFFISYMIVQIIKVLGEGGFSFVYLAQDEHSGVRSDNIWLR